jgi:hypothetical protein
MSLVTVLTSSTMRLRQQSAQLARKWRSHVRNLPVPLVQNLVQLHMQAMASDMVFCVMQVLSWPQEAKGVRVVPFRLHHSINPVDLLGSMW